MKNYFRRTFYRLDKMLIILVIGITLFASCTDENYYANHNPEWLGASIYDYLKTDKHYTNYVKLIDDLGYKETLSKTGSKTLFVANDSAFNIFFSTPNVWGVKSYDQLTLAQKKLILNFGMINNAYTSDNLPNYFDVSLQTGAAMRRSTAISIYDSIPYDSGNQLPFSSYFNKNRTKGIHILKDNTAWPIMQFTQKQMDQVLITDDDFSFLTGSTRVKNDVHIFGNKVIKRDVTCKNGYINVLDNVLVPPVNMAQYIKSNSNTQIFSKLLDRFCAPYFNPGNTLEYNQLQLAHPELHSIDSIFIKKYFSSVGGATAYPGPDGRASGAGISNELLLPYDPGWNSYVNGSSALQADMAAMFVPSDVAMTDYFNTGVLKSYGSWENVPDKIIMSFLQRHMRVSLIASVPSRFDKMMDAQNSVLPVQKGDITPGNVYLGVNGAVYITNKVYPPDEYSSVYAPVLFGNNTKVFDWFIKNYVNGVFLYKFYLLSLVNTYSFFVPTDDVFNKYIDPVAYSKTMPAAIKFWYNPKTSSVNATIYKYDKTNPGAVLTSKDSVSVITSKTDVGMNFILNRLLDVMDSHIVVGGVESGNNYYLSKGNNVIRVTGSGANMTVEGGGDIAMGTVSHVTNAFTQSNGHTYYIDKPIQTPLESVYKVLGENDAFSGFYQLLSGFPTGSEIFKSMKGMDYNVKFLNTYNYTVYVPTNDAINTAIQNGVITPWVSQGSIVGINDMTDATVKAAAISKLDLFLRYHFQDNSIFVNGKSITNKYYTTAALKNNDLASPFGTNKGKFYQLIVNVSSSDVTLSTESGKTVKVLTSNNMYNLMARDFIFGDKPSAFKEVDGSSTGAEFKTSTIETSSTAVIHQISDVLTFQ